MVRCSFCDRAARDVPKLIHGPRVFICDGCAGDAGHLLATRG
jgi:ATP-dependent protease Clp ATPase subunit